MPDTTDKEKIIELTKKLRERENNSGRKPGPLGATKARVRMVKEMAKQAIAENAEERLTEQEKEFAELVVSGASLVSAYEQAFPEICYAIEDNGKEGEDRQEYVVDALSYERKYSRANALSKKNDVRSTIILLLEREQVEESHTASRLDNFIVKRLEAEANNPSNSASARIAALKALSEHRAVAIAEQNHANRVSAATSDEVMERIQSMVNAASSGNKKE